jgi:hypothetical protein
VETTHSVKLLALGVNVFHVENVLEQNAGHFAVIAIQIVSKAKWI